MQYWAVAPTSGRAVIDAVHASRMVGALGSANSTALADAFLDAIGDALQARHCSVLCFEGERSPRLLSAASRGCEWLVFDAASHYARYHYQKDDVQQLIRRYPASFDSPTVIVHRQSADEIVDADYRAACYQNIDIADRATVLVRIGRAQSLAVNFYRERRAGLYSDEDMSQLIGLAPLLASCAARHYALDGQNLAAFRGVVTDELAQLCPRLTTREREVVQRVLDGATTERIAEELRIRPTTVVTYRERAYEKLGVNTQRDLFAALLARRSATAAPPDAPRLPS